MGSPSPIRHSKVEPTFPFKIEKKPDNQINPLNAKVRRVTRPIFRSASLVALGSAGAVIGAVAIGSIGLVSVISLGAAAFAGALLGTTAGVIYFLAKDILAKPGSEKKKSREELNQQEFTEELNQQEFTGELKQEEFTGELKQEEFTKESYEALFVTNAIATALLPDIPGISKASEANNPNPSADSSNTVPLPLSNSLLASFNANNPNPSADSSNTVPLPLSNSLLASFNAENPNPSAESSNLTGKISEETKEFQQEKDDASPSLGNSNVLKEETPKEKLSDDDEIDDEITDSNLLPEDDSSLAQEASTSSKSSDSQKTASMEKKKPDFKLSESWIVHESVLEEEGSSFVNDVRESVNQVTKSLNTGMGTKQLDAELKKTIRDLVVNEKLKTTEPFKFPVDGEETEVPVPKQFLRDSTGVKNLTLNEQTFNAASSDVESESDRKKKVMAFFYKELGEKLFKRVGTLVHQSFFVDVCEEIQGVFNEITAVNPDVVLYFREDVGEKGQGGYDFNLKTKDGILELKATTPINIVYVDPNGNKENVGFVYMERELSIPLEELGRDLEAASKSSFPRNIFAREILPGLEVTQRVTNVCKTLEDAKTNLDEPDFVVL